MRKQLSVIRLNRRAFLLAGGAGLAARAAAAEDPILRKLIEQQGGAFGFYSASRPNQVPRSSLPTLWPATVGATEQAIARYQQIVANGGWPTVPPVNELRLGHQNPGGGGRREGPDGA